MKPSTEQFTGRSIPALSQQGSFTRDKYIENSLDHIELEINPERDSRLTFDPLFTPLPIPAFDGEDLKVKDNKLNTKTSDNIELSFLKPIKFKKRMNSGNGDVQKNTNSETDGKTEKEPEESGETETPTNAINSCQGEKTGLSRLLIAEKLREKQQTNNTIVIQNIVLVCFPSNPFRHLSNPIFSTIEIFNSTIGIFADRVFAEDIFREKSFLVIESFVENFGDQKGTFFDKVLFLDS
eukprot:snap_masked-scaffold_10-processed-gene-13.13-mRNA-1 protein AED:1.00 eAED:1.00 QI:0/0/0/0/1/1/2/0/237